MSRSGNDEVCCFWYERRRKVASLVGIVWRQIQSQLLLHMKEGGARKASFPGTLTVFSSE